MSSTQRTNITVKRAVLIYCITTGLPVDAVIMIKADILKCIEGSSTGGRGHVYLITALCDKAGSNLGKHKVTMQQSHINSDNIVRYEVWTGSEPPHLPPRRIFQTGCAFHQFDLRLDDRAKDRAHQRVKKRASTPTTATGPHFTLDDIGNMMVHQNAQLAYMRSAMEDLHIRHAHMALYIQEFSHAMQIHYDLYSKTDPEFPQFFAYLLHPYHPSSSPNGAQHEEGDNVIESNDNDDPHDGVDPILGSGKLPNVTMDK